MISLFAKSIIGFVGVVIAVILGVLFFLYILPKNKPVLPLGKMSKQITATSAASDAFSASHSLAPLATNQWYSSLLFDFPSQPVYALPIAYSFSSAGVGFSYPDIKKTPNTIFAPFVEDFTVGLGSDFTKPEIQAIGDFSIGLHMQTKDATALSFTIGHGIPFTVFHTNGDTLVLNIPNEYQLYDDNSPTAWATTSGKVQSVVLATRNHYYIIAFDEKKVVDAKKGLLTIQNPQKIFIGLLDTRKEYDAFQSISHTEVTDTSVTSQIVNDTVVSTYQVATNGKNSLLALYPHQSDFLTSEQPVLGSYTTLRGPLSLISASQFVTKIPAVVPPDTFSKLPNQKADLTEQIQKDIASVIKEKQPDSKDYYLGTWFGKVTNLLLLADTFGLESEKKQLLEFIEPIFVKSLTEFSYDKTTTSIVANKPEFGNEKNNDHHFHYGYYIRTAAVLAKFDPSLLASVTPQISEMVADIANTNRDNTKYPFLRHFDMYEGHSWADGHAGFGDGNNQESSSEAMNAWYAVYLWSSLVNNANLKTYALYLYNTEIQSAYYYWFDIKNLYGDPYAHAMASIVWGGKVDFSTWFSAEPNMIYGIQLLPFTPASDYLGKLADFPKYAKDFQASGGGIGKEWGDLFTMWQSYYAPKEVLSDIDLVTKFEGNNTKSMLLYTLYKNAENTK